jgi:hypothetical protein
MAFSEKSGKGRSRRQLGLDQKDKLDYLTSAFAKRQTSPFFL